MKGSEASKRLNALREELFTSQIKLLMNDVRQNQPEKCSPESPNLNTFIEDITSVPSKKIEDMSIQLGSFAPHIISQVFDRFQLANHYYRKMLDKEIPVSEQDSDFLLQSLVKIACLPEASLQD